jgi:hypothetical protein
MNYLYGFIIDGIVYLDMIEVGHRSAHWKKEYLELVEAYEPEASFVIKDGAGLVINDLDDFADVDEGKQDDVRALVTDLVGVIGIDGLNDETYDYILESGDYMELADLILEDEAEELAEDED